MLRLGIRVGILALIGLWAWLDEGYLHSNETVSTVVISALFLFLVIGPYIFMWLLDRR